MLRIDKNDKKLVRLAESALAGANHWERELQLMICAAPTAFCEEMGESLWVIGQEVRPSDAVQDRIDILALDEAGGAVVIELKRGSHKMQLLQAVSYAGMMSRWAPDRFVETLAANYNQSSDDARAAIEEHTGSDISSINNAQRIFADSQDFDPALLVATEWLHENFGVDIRCYRLHLSQESGNDYLTCTCIYPPIEIANLTRGTDNKQGRTGTADWESWRQLSQQLKILRSKTLFEQNSRSTSQGCRAVISSTASVESVDFMLAAENSMHMCGNGEGSKMTKRIGKECYRIPTTFRRSTTSGHCGFV